MAFVPAPQIIMCEVRATRFAQQIENRFMVNNLSTVTPADLAGVASIILDWATDVYFPLLDSSTVLTEVVCTDLTTQNGEQVTVAPPEPVAGGFGNSPMPNEVSYVVSLRSGARGRSARGRVYVLGLDRGAVSGNDVIAPYRASITAAFTALISNLDIANKQLTIVSYRTNNAPRPGGPVYFPVAVATTVDAGVDSMRRRKPGVGS